MVILLLLNFVVLPSLVHVISLGIHGHLSINCFIDVNGDLFLFDLGKMLWVLCWIIELLRFRKVPMQVIQHFGKRRTSKRPSYGEMGF